MTRHEISEQVFPPIETFSFRLVYYKTRRIISGVRLVRCRENIASKNPLLNLTNRFKAGVLMVGD